MTYLAKQASSLPLIGRLLIAGIFLISGVGKIAAPAMTMSYMQSTGLPLPMLGLLGAIAVETVGGLLLVLGWQTRAIALMLAAFSIVTGLVFHSAIGDQNQMIHLLKNFAMAGGLLQVAAFGGGALSLDGRRAFKAAPASL
jgi:putative oxidoreductase